MTAAHEPIRHTALARTTGDRVLRDVVRNASDAEIRRTALARITDPAVLRSIAVGDDRLISHCRLERITDPSVLRAVATPAPPEGVRPAPASPATDAGDRPPIGRKRGAPDSSSSVAVESLTGARDLRAAEQIRAVQHEAFPARDVAPREDVARRLTGATRSSMRPGAWRRQARSRPPTALRENPPRTFLCERVEGSMTPTHPPPR
jgi:hypothetical protein